MYTEFGNWPQEVFRITICSQNFDYMNAEAILYVAYVDANLTWDMFCV